MPYVALILALIPYLAFASGRIINRLQSVCRNASSILIALALLLIPYLMVTAPAALTAPAHFAGNLLEMICFVALPAFALIHRPPAQKSLGATDILVILFVALPVKFHLLPPAPVHAGFNISVDVTLLTAVDSAFFLFLVVRPLAHIGYSFQLKASDLGAAFLGVAAYTVVAIPLGLGIGFIAFQPGASGAAAIALQWLGIYFITALPEEFLFRGLIQNLLKDRLGSGRYALLIASLIFGLSHINKATAGHGTPNFEYVVMATLAGLAYGWVWQKTSKISASAMTHATVNCVWHTLLSG